MQADDGQQLAADAHYFQVIGRAGDLACARLQGFFDGVDGNGVAVTADFYYHPFDYGQCQRYAHGEHGPGAGLAAHIYFAS